MFMLRMVTASRTMIVSVTMIMMYARIRATFTSAIEMLMAMATRLRSADVSVY